VIEMNAMMHNAYTCYLPISPARKRQITGKGTFM